MAMVRVRRRGDIGLRLRDYTYYGKKDEPAIYLIHYNVTPIRYGQSFCVRPDLTRVQNVSWK